MSQNQRHPPHEHDHEPDRRRIGDMRWQFTHVVEVGDRLGELMCDALCLAREFLKDRNAAKEVREATAKLKEQSADLAGAVKEGEA